MIDASDLDFAIKISTLIGAVVAPAGAVIWGAMRLGGKYDSLQNTIGLLKTEVDNLKIRITELDREMRDLHNMMVRHDERMDAFNEARRQVNDLHSTYMDRAPLWKQKPI